MANFPNKKPEKSLFKEDQDMIDSIAAKAAMDAEISKQAKAKKDAKKNTVDYSEATRPKKTTPEKKTWKDVKSVAAAKKAGLKHYTGADGNKKLAITKEELGQKKGETLTQAYNRVQGKTPRNQSAASGTKSKTPKKKGFRPFGGAIRRALLGKDEKFGGDKGAIDFIRRKKKPKNKAGGGMMKSKMSSKGGKMGGKMAPGYNEGGEAKVKKPNRRAVLKSLMTIGKRKAQELHGKAAVNQAVKDLNQISGVTPTKKIKTEKEKKLAGADSRASMSKFSKKTPAAKKQDQVRTTEKRLERGFKNGGMAKKGYSKGGAVKKKSKPRGVGAALRGYGKAMR